MDRTSKHLKEQIQNIIKRWWGSKTPKLIVSLVDLNEPGAVNEQQSSTHNCDELFQSGYEELCETIVKVLPSDALLITGQRRGFIDFLIEEEIAKGSHLTAKMNTHDPCKNNPLRSVIDEQIKKETNAQLPHEELENEKCTKSAQPLALSLLGYIKFSGPEAVIRDRGYRETISDSNGQREKRLSMYRDKKNHWIECVNFPPAEISGTSKAVRQSNKISVITISPSRKASSSNNLSIEMMCQKESLEDALQCIMSGKSVSISNEVESSYPTIDISDGEKKVSKFLRFQICKFLLEDNAGNKDFDLLENQLYDDELLKELLDQASKGNISDFKFDSASKENWVKEFLDETDDDDSRFSKSDSKKPKESEEKDKVLMILSVELGMDIDFIMRLWKKGKDKLAMALMAYKVSKLQYEQHEGSKKGVVMQKQMQHFQDLAISVLSQVSLLDERKHFWYLNTRIESLDVSAIEIALQSKCERFLAEAPCKKLMDEIWTDPIEKFSRYFYSLFIISLLCPLLSPFLVKFDEESEFLEQFDIEYEDDSTKLGYNFSFEESIVRQFADKICCCGPFNKGVKYIWYVRSFLNAPIVRYIYALIYHLLHLLLFSIVMLTGFNKEISHLESALYAWTLIIAIEEIKQAYNEGKEYLNKWNLLDDIGLILFVIGVSLRIPVTIDNQNLCPSCFYAARIVLAFSLMVLILRTLQLLDADSRLGPKIHMMGRLIKDLIGFMLILAVFITAYGIGSNVILYPNQTLNSTLLKNVFSDAWWSVFAQFNIEEAEGSRCDGGGTKYTVEYCRNTTNPDIEYEECKNHKCPADNWIVSVLLACYALVVVIMMLNVLIAMFNDTFSNIEDKKTEIYNVNRFELMCEHSNKSILPGPFCVITYWKFVPWCISGGCKLCWKKCCKRGKRKERKPWALFRRNLPSWANDIEDEPIKMEDERVAEAELFDAKIRLDNLGKLDFETANKFLSALTQQTSN